MLLPVFLIVGFVNLVAQRANYNIDVTSRPDFDIRVRRSIRSGEIEVGIEAPEVKTENVDRIEEDEDTKIKFEHYTNNLDTNVELNHGNDGGSKKSKRNAFSFLNVFKYIINNNYFGIKKNINEGNNSRPYISSYYENRDRRASTHYKHTNNYDHQTTGNTNMFNPYNTTYPTTYNNNLYQYNNTAFNGYNNTIYPYNRFAQNTNSSYYRHGRNSSFSFNGYNAAIPFGNGTSTYNGYNSALPLDALNDTRIAFNNTNVSLPNRRNDSNGIENRTEEMVIAQGCLFCATAGCPTNQKRVGFRCVPLDYDYY